MTYETVLDDVYASAYRYWVQQRYVRRLPLDLDLTEA